MDSGGKIMSGRVLILTSERIDAPGGMEHVLSELKKGLDGFGYSVSVLHRGNVAPGWVVRPRNKWMAYVADVALSWYLGRKVGELRGLDLVAIVSNGPLGWYLPRLPKSVKKVHFYHGTYRGQAQVIRPFIAVAGALKLKWWDSMVLERQSGRGKLIVCNSDQTRQEIQDFFGYLGKTIWLPLDTRHFAPRDQLESRQKLKLPVARKIGLFVGSSQPTKGFSTVLKLIQVFPEVHWCLALRGSIPVELKSSENLSVFFDAGRDLLPWLYNAADFSVCPSLYESFGYVVAESLACGVPVVASLGGASSALLRDTPLSNLLVSDARSGPDFENAIRGVLADSVRQREEVVRLVRPEIEKKMALENWLDRFREVTNI
jgi:glycosyltransferase involved in cell wall biosynthesis